jgi:AcrR family transcriptional regulator
MSRPRRVSDDDIFLAVRRAVVEQGPRVSLDVVAERLGVTAPALFRRFGSRNDLLIRALRPEEHPAFLDALDAGPDARPMVTQLTDLFTAIANYFDCALPCMSALRESGIDFDSVDATFEEPPPLRIVRVLGEWLGRARSSHKLAIEDPSATATALLGAVQAPIFFRHISKSTEPFDAVEHARGLARLFLRGIAPASPSARATKVRRVTSKPPPRPRTTKER